MTDMNPRVLRDHLGPWVGKKVMIGTSDFHYVSGVVQSVEGAQVKVTVGGKLVIIPTANVATINEASPYQAEYVK